MASRLPSINLLKKNRSFIDQFLSWALTIGRVVVVCVELVALGAFLYRFTLDRQIIDLKDQIEEKQGVLAILKGDEDKFRDMQNRLSLISKQNSQAIDKANQFTGFVGLSPEGFVIDKIIVNENSVKIDANTNSVASLSNYVTALQESPDISSVSVDRIENKPSQSTIFVSITGKLKGTE